MVQKIYYDTVNNKEVVDVSGIKDEASVKGEFMLDPSVQILEVDNENGETHYVDNGALKKKTKTENDAEKLADKATKDTEVLAKRTNLKTSMGWTDEQLDAILDLTKNS